MLRHKKRQVVKCRWSRVVSVLVTVFLLFSFSLPAFLLALALPLCFFRLPLLPATPTRLLVALQILQAARIEFADLAVAGNSSDEQDLTAAVQRSMAANGTLAEIFLVAQNVEGKIGDNMMAGGRVDGRVDGQRQTHGQINVNISHRGLELRCRKSLCAGVELRQDTSCGGIGTDACPKLQEVNAAPRCFRHHSPARPAKADASSGGL